MDEKKEYACLGLLAHVDAGKTTLSEALLYRSGALRAPGRVDHADAYLDTHTLERARGITIFSKQALFSTPTRRWTLVDTPGHADFSAEAERTLPILDGAILLISASDGIQAHTLTLWQLLRRYEIPTLIFVNKTDLPDVDRDALLAQLQREFGSNCVDFEQPRAAIEEAAALCDEALLENYLESGTVTSDNIRNLIEKRRLFPCLFGSALRLRGINRLLEVLDEFFPRPTRGTGFAATVYKISRDAQGNRLSWLKLTGGELALRSVLPYKTRGGDAREEKITSIRLYSADKFTAVERIFPGQIAAVTGLTESYAGQGLGAAQDIPLPTLEPVMTYRLGLPAGKDVAVVLPLLRQLEEEDPMLHLNCEGENVHIQIMGAVQLEIFRALVRERFGFDVQPDSGSIFYKETITNTVEGVGHFEPLRHYAEVHLLLEPLPRGSGLQFATNCPTELLDESYQSLILTHMAEKTHRGVLIGAPITDLRITLMSGRSHLKHTEGGDFRQATYRAIRQGLMQARSLLLEPWYRFRLRVPTEQIGRAITDIRAKGGEFEPPQAQGNFSSICGTLPASELGDYPQQVAAYTQGRGQLHITPDGYRPCHDAPQVIEKADYDAERDMENTPDSVFCAHGAGFTVKWDRVKEYMHLESCLRAPAAPQVIARNLWADDRELEKIMQREFGTPTTVLYRPPREKEQPQTLHIRPPKKQYLIVDGYNIIFAWETLAHIAAEDLEAARRMLCDRLSSYAGFCKVETIVVFDGYQVRGNPGEKLRYHNIGVVFTRENETGDRYIESLVAEIGTNHNLRVATSDALVQLGALRSGVLRMSARELLAEIEQAERDMKKYG